MKYSTQMDTAKKGIITKEMEIVAKKEHMAVEDLKNQIARGILYPEEVLCFTLGWNLITGRTHSLSIMTDSWIYVKNMM